MIKIDERKSRNCKQIAIKTGNACNLGSYSPVSSGPEFHLQNYSQHYIILSVGGRLPFDLW
jgi:hypothetical protein